jgi:hypothetical protein
MINHRLADDYVMANLFIFCYDLLQSFCPVCKNFLLTSFMNENEVFPLKIIIIKKTHKNTKIKCVKL